MNTSFYRLLIFIFLGIALVLAVVTPQITDSNEVYAVIFPIISLLTFFALLFGIALFFISQYKNR
jgi:ACR3 family arsenite efflux pump ArsB